MRKHFVRAAGFRKEWLVQFSQLQLSASSDSDFRLLTAYRLGAETPSPPMIFLLSANLGGIGKDFVGLDVCRGTAGMNTAMTAPEVVLFGFSSRLPRFQIVVTAPTAIYSLAVGARFLFGSSGLLPPLDEAAGGPSGRKAVPGSSFCVIVLCFNGRVIQAPHNSSLYK